MRCDGQCEAKGRIFGADVSLKRGKGSMDFAKPPFLRVDFDWHV